MIFNKKTRPNGASGLVVTIPTDVVSALNIKPYDIVTVDIIKVIKK